MKIGQIIRKLLGKNISSITGRMFRSIFVDLNVLCACFPKMENGSSVLDIGGGDGYLLNYLLSIQPNLNIRMIDIAADIGFSIKTRFKYKVKLLPKTSVSDYADLNLGKPDFILICDVIHHLVSSDRNKFLNDLKILIGSDKAKLVIKEVEPGHLLSWFGYLTDRYISGDKNTNLISQNELISLMKQVFSNMIVEKTELYKLNTPNYCLIFTNLYSK